MVLDGRKGVGAGVEVDLGAVDNFDDHWSIKIIIKGETIII